jgi:hypothetical protein
MTEFEEGFLLGILVGEGHFGGDGKQAQVTVRMHARHSDLFHWLALKVNGSRLYGPYHHAGRHYYQWMVRGQALKTELLPLLQRQIDHLDGHVRGRIEAMISTYKLLEEHAGLT